MPNFVANTDRVAVIGAGIVGLACSLELARRGVAVTMYDNNPVTGHASRTAAGMLAPAFEATRSDGRHPRLFDLCYTGSRLWTDWAHDIEKRTRMSVACQYGPSLAVATSTDECERLHALVANLRDHPAKPAWLQPHDLAGRFPGLGSGILSGILLPSDGQVDNRLVITALIRLCKTEPGITIKTGRASLTGNTEGQITHDGYAATLICAGWQSPLVTVTRNGQTAGPGCLSQAEPALRAITACRGQMLVLNRVDGAPEQTVRAGDVYIVPKTDRIIIGATVEPGQTQPAVNARAIQDLHNRAIAIWPALANADIIEKRAGIRPQTGDEAPLLGRLCSKNLYVAAGHYRNGILLAPVTARIMADMIVDNKTDALADAFTPARFVSKDNHTSDRQPGIQADMHIHERETTLP